MRASEFRRSEEGLYLPVHACLKGRVRWSTLDERGVPEVPRNPSGFALGPLEGVEQDNLITDLGLDHLAASSVTTIHTSANGWRSVLAVGSGSTTPDVTDTALDNELQRTSNSSGSFPYGANTGALDAVNDVWRITSFQTRIVTMSADRNLTEFGFVPGGMSGSNFVIRELLRDGGGSPITVSLLNGKTIRIDHTLFIEIPAPPSGLSGSVNIDEFDAANNPVSSVAYSWVGGLYVDTATSARIAGDSTNEVGGFVSSQPNIFAFWNPALTQVTAMGVSRLTVDKTYARTGISWSGGDQDGAVTTTTGALGNFAWQGYTPGTHQRVKRATVPTGAGNAAWRGFVIRPSAANSGTNGSTAGLLVDFDSPATYTKVNTDTLRVGIVSSWARA